MVEKRYITTFYEVTDWNGESDMGGFPSTRVVARFNCLVDAERFANIANKIVGIRSPFGDDYYEVRERVIPGVTFDDESDVKSILKECNKQKTSKW